MVRDDAPGLARPRLLRSRGPPALLRRAMATSARLNWPLRSEPPTAKRAHAVRVLDRAGWHTPNKLERPYNITFLPRPPMRPELDPVENVWQYLRQSYLSNRIFDT